MSRAFWLAVCLFLSACSTTSTVHQPTTAGTSGPYGYSFENYGGDDLAAIVELDRTIQRTLRDAGVFVPGTDAPRIEITVTHFYVRSNGARFWAGVMAGRDKISSRIRIVDAAGTQLADFQVESTNATALGSSGGLMEKHAAEILSRLR